MVNVAPMQNSLGTAPLGMSQENWDIIKLLLKIGAVGTVVSLPVGLWAIKRWPEHPMVPAAILTVVGLIIKEVMISRGEEADVGGQSPDGAPPSLSGYRRMPVSSVAR